MACCKQSIGQLAVFGGPPCFSRPRSTSNLASPDLAAFLDYSRLFYEAGQYTNHGPCNQLLETRLAHFHGVRYCVTFSSGFWAIALCMQLLALPGKHKVIMPSLTYRRMADIAAWTHLEPVFCEVDPESLAVTAETVSACIDDDTALILAAHPIINCCELEGLEQLAQARGIPLLLDSVESVHEHYQGKKTGGFGRAEAFSIHACKLINGFGGGYITTNDGDLAQKLAIARGFGFVGVDEVASPFGMNAKLNEMHAAMALASLDEVAQQVVLNEQRYRLYLAELAMLPGIRLVPFIETQRPGYKNIVAEILPGWPFSRDETVRLCNAENILCRAYYDPPLHRRNPGVAGGVSGVQWATTDRLAATYINLPCGQHVSLDDIQEICDFLRFIAAHAEAIKARMSEGVA